jgi:hypothetical protein
MSEPGRIELSTLRPRHWKNGAGLTREIAVAPEGAGLEDFDWRLSVAELQRDVPFSAFPGVDRCIVVLSGACMSLHDAQGAEVQTLRRLEPWRFEGERPLHARLPAGPCRDFNVMTRRPGWRAAVRVLRGRDWVDLTDATLLLAVDGSWRIAGESAGPLQGRLWRAPAEAALVEPRSEDASLLLVQLCHDRRP